MKPGTAMRHLFADTALSLGPDAPTLCTPWTVRDLVAHEVVRQSRPDALPGIGLDVGVLRRRTETVQAEIARRDFEELVRTVRQGPPVWWPTRLPGVDELVNTAEFAVHHEDMVRAQPGWEPGPSPYGPELATALWKQLRQAGRVAYRSAPVGVVAVADDYGRVALRRPRPGTGTVVLRGEPIELLLHAFGRTDAAQVRLEGSDADVGALLAHARAF